MITNTNHVDIERTKPRRTLMYICAKTLKGP